MFAEVMCAAFFEKEREKNIKKHSFYNCIFSLKLSDVA